MLKYKLINHFSGEVRTWKGEARKCHNTLRGMLKQDLTSFPESHGDIEIIITGNGSETYHEKAYDYLSKLVAGKVKGFTLVDVEVSKDNPKNHKKKGYTLGYKEVK